MRPARPAILALALLVGAYYLIREDPMSRLDIASLGPAPSPHFSWGELLTTSTSALQELPSPWEAESLRELAGVLEVLRAHIGRPIRVTSAYRSPALNDAVGGSSTSQHMAGEAADIMVSGLDAHQLQAAIRELQQTGAIAIGQAIAYAPSRGGHVHMSLPGRHVAQYLTAPAEGGYRAA